MIDRAGGEAGVVATQLAIVMPAVLLLVMLTVQFALWAHATQLADAAADAAATTAAVVQGTTSAGEEAASSLLAQAGNLADVTIEVERGLEAATATVTGVAPNVVPGFRWSVTGRAAAPLEVFIPEGQR